MWTNPSADIYTKFNDSCALCDLALASIKFNPGKKLLTCFLVVGYYENINKDFTLPRLLYVGNIIAWTTHFLDEDSSFNFCTDF